MVQTRGKGKAKEAGADGTPELEYPSFAVPVPEDLDLDSLSNVLPDFDFHSPSPEAVVLLYQLIVTQSSTLDTTQRDLDEARAESEKKEVELDQALQDRETQTQDLETQLESLQEELKQVKKERDQLGASIVTNMAGCGYLYVLYQSPRRTRCKQKWRSCQACRHPRPQNFKSSRTDLMTRNVKNESCSELSVA